MIILLNSIRPLIFKLGFIGTDIALHKETALVLVVGQPFKPLLIIKEVKRLTKNDIK